jgi:hypothetical protein
MRSRSRSGGRQADRIYAAIGGGFAGFAAIDALLRQPAESGRDLNCRTNAVASPDGGHHGREIASRTEQYFCPIKHALPMAGAHSRYSRFVEYGNAQEYRDRIEQLRKTAAEP